METEIWKQVEGYKFYQVSNLGRVKGLPRPPDSRGYPRQYKQERILKPGADGWGYLSVVLCENCKQKTTKVARLVTEAFIGPKPTTIHQINHKDGNIKNNCVANLEWVTPSENVKHSYNELPHSRALKKDEIEEIRKMLSCGLKDKDISNATGRSMSVIGYIRRGERRYEGHEVPVPDAPGTEPEDEVIE